MRRSIHLFQISPLACALLAATPAVAQQAPDAGQTLQQIQPPVLSVPRPAPDVSIHPPAEAGALPGGGTVTLAGVRLSGHSVFTDAELLAVLGEIKGQSFDLAGLQALAHRISDHYRSHGYPFARALIPAQNFADGMLTIRIVEGRYGRITAQGAFAAQAQDALAGLKPGAVIEAAPLEHAILLLADQPGITVTPLVRPGQEAGTGDLVVDVARGPRAQGEVSLGNHGNRYSGVYQARLALQADSPFTLGDQFRGQFLYTDEGLWLGSLAYSLPLGTDGLRGTIAYSHTYYELGKDFESLKAHGTAKVSMLGLSYPIIRSQAARLIMGLSYQHKDLEDRQNATATRNAKQSDALPLLLQFDRRDALGITYGVLAYTAGRLKLDSVLEAADIASNTGTRGHFDKWNLDLARLQTTPVAQLTLFGRASVQWAGKNLDSSESFLLGGPNGVRAYPVGEGNGDEGWFMQLEARYRLGRTESFVFYDVGCSRSKADPGRIKPAVTDNTRSISGSGLGLRYADEPFSAEVSLAWRGQGGQPKSDTKDDNPRLWASLAWRF